MQLTVHTPHGVFKGVSEPYDETKYQLYKETLEGIHKLAWFRLATDVGQCYLTEEIINQSVFLLSK